MKITRSIYVFALAALLCATSVSFAGSNGEVFGFDHGGHTVSAPRRRCNPTARSAPGRARVAGPQRTCRQAILFRPSPPGRALVRARSRRTISVLITSADVTGLARSAYTARTFSTLP